MMAWCAFQLRMKGHVLRVVSLCLILNVLFVVGNRAVAQTLTLDAKDNSAQKFFDPDGYYFPGGADFVVGEWKVEWIDIHTLDYYYDDGYHYDSPRSIPPDVRLIISRQKDQKKFTYKCPNPIVSQDVLSVSCPVTSIGAVSIQGIFLDKRGKFSDREAEIIPYETVVLTATITVENKLGHRFSRQIPFTYWGGD